MEVILLERIARLGGIGEVVDVRNGYGRNFLIPMKKALRATVENKKVFEEQRQQIEAENAKARAAAEIHAKKLEGVSVKVVRQASQEGKLYGSVTVHDISLALKESGHDVAKSQIVQTANVTLTVVRIESHAA
jgi:large subunit ribosomal protein L9